MSYLSWPVPKDPDDVCEYQFKWTNRLEVGETIVTSTFEIEGTIVHDADDDDISGAFTTFWVSGGTPGEVCLITNHIVTSEGREYDRTGKLRIKER